jgi:hypothetical protein
MASALVPSCTCRRSGWTAPFTVKSRDSVKLGHILDSLIT